MATATRITLAIAAALLLAWVGEALDQHILNTHYEAR